MKPSGIELMGWVVPYWLAALVIYAVWLAVAWSVKRALFAWLERATRATDTEVDDLIIDSVNAPLNVMLLVWGANLSIRLIAPVPVPTWIAHVASISKLLSVFAAVLFVDFLLINIMRLYAKRVDVIRSAHSFLKALIHVVVISLGVLVTLDTLGVSITPIIASLGIGSLAVALALQPTFENIFAGFQIFLDKPVLPGHFVRLETGEEGFIERIGWRTIWLRQLTNNTVILPNKQLVGGRILNYNYPDKVLVVPIEVGVHYHSNLDHVEKVAIEVGQKIMQSADGGVPEWTPLVRFHTFADSSINCTVVLRASAFDVAATVRHEFVKALSKRFAEEKIVIPYPTRTLHSVQETVGK